MLLTTVGDEKGEGNVEGEQVITESYIFLVKDDLEFGEWDFAEFKRDKLKKWTRAGYVFEGKCELLFPLGPVQAKRWAKKDVSCFRHI